MVQERVLVLGSTDVTMEEKDRTHICDTRCKTPCPTTTERTESLLGRFALLHLEQSFAFALT